MKPFSILVFAAWALFSILFVQSSDDPVRAGIVIMPIGIIVGWLARKLE